MYSEQKFGKSWVGMILKRQRDFFTVMLWLVLGASQAWGLEVAEDFSSRTYRSEGDLVWNTAVGFAHPPFEIKDYVDNIGNVTASRGFTIGTGADGVFGPETYHLFSEGGDVSGNIIRLNTDRYPELNVESFLLEENWILRPVEGSEPLIIRSLGEVVIKGQIDCSGEDGIAHQNFTQVARGGRGRCGGGHGGDGAYVDGNLTIAPGAGEFFGEAVSLVSPSAGEAPTGDLGSGSGGGGGGAYSATGATESEPGTSSGTGVGGLAGDVTEDHEFFAVGGGAGGGGGAMDLTISLSGSRFSGAGGGAGGGYIAIFAGGHVSVYPTGSVLANGGAGGGTNGTAVLAGAGGGGGGGSILIFSGGEVYTSGPVRAHAGAGGYNANGVSGGKGAVGRTWLAGKSGFAIALPTEPLDAEQPATLLAHVGMSVYQTGTFNLTTEAFDTLSTRPEVLNAILDVSLSAGSSSSLEVSSGTSANFTSSWVAVSSVTSPLSRYVRFRLSVSNADAVQGSFVERIGLEYKPFVQTEFEFQEGAGCGRVQSRSEPDDGMMWLLVFVFGFPVWLTWTLRSRV